MMRTSESGALGPFDLSKADLNADMAERLHSANSRHAKLQSDSCQQGLSDLGTETRNEHQSGQHESERRPQTDEVKVC